MIQRFKKGLSRAAGLTLGWLFMVLAFLGVLLPLVPATPFALLAAFFFSKYSPAVHQWLLNLPYLGDAIQEWSQNRVIRPRAKALAVACMACSLLVVFFHPLPPWWGKLTAALLLLAVAIFILTRKSR